EALNLSEPKDASYTLTDGKVTVVPAVDGKEIDAESLAAAVEEAAVKSGDERTAAAGVTTEKAEFTTDEATKLAPTKVIGEFTTYFPHSSSNYRNNNLGQAAKSINGTVLLPGETFSLNDTLGERTAENGYIDGYVINGGVLVKESGGGISQSATTLYNAAFFAGYEDIEHKPHSLYFDRYPAGREATVYYGSLDMRFRNDTEYPSYIQGYITEATNSAKGSITFRIWSIPTYDRVVSTELVKSGYYSGSDRVSDDPNCEPQAPIQGFTVNWSRLFYKGDEVVKKEDYSWQYSAGDRITCA
ncbi:MAG: VanW family protein, partial [Arachnia sp.]